MINPYSPIVYNRKFSLMTQTLQERRSVAAEQVDTMLSTLSEKKIQKITELFDRTVIQEELDDANLTEEWEAYHDWLAIRTGSAFHPLSNAGNGKHKLVPDEDYVSEESKVGADLEEESKSFNEPSDNAEVFEHASAIDVTDEHVEQEFEEVDEPVEVTAEPVVAKVSESFFSSDDDDLVELDDANVVTGNNESESGRISVNDVLQKEFTIEKLRGGYNENDVDDFLDDIAAFLNESHTNAELDEKIASVEGQGFHRKKLGSGCNVNEVDAYLDELVAELKARKN
jgi:DivIVA domain-containing protein